MKKKSVLERWRNRKKEGSASEGLKITKNYKKPREAKTPLSFDQQRLLFLQQLSPDNPFYNYADVYELHGDLKQDYLIKSFEYIVQRHNILRTTFHFEGEEVVPKVSSEAKFNFNTFDVSHLPPNAQDAESRKLALQISQNPFYLDQGPLMSVSLVKRSPIDHLMVITMHHIITDKWSMKVIRAELSAAYTGFLLNQPPAVEPLPFQFEDYAYWNRSTPINTQYLNYWKEKLKGSTPVLQLPFDHSRPVKPRFKGAYNKQYFPTDLAEKLRALSKEWNVTLYVLLLTTYKIILHRYSNQDDILVGTPFTSRDSPDLEKLIGFFNETLVLRSDLSDTPRFVDILKEVHKTVMDAFAHHGVPLETLVKELKPDRSLGSNPLFQVMFIYHGIPPTPSFGDDLVLKHTPFDFGVSKFDLTLYIADGQEDLSATIEYDTDLFDAATIDRMHEHLLVLLEQIVENPEQRISDFSLLGEAEKDTLLSRWNNNKTQLPDVSGIHQLIENYAHKTPTAKAVKFQDSAYSYSELDGLANRVAKTLQEQGVKRGTAVGLCADRSLQMIVGILGILKAGAAYLPIDPTYPWDRISFMVEDAAVPLVLSQKNQLANFSEGDFKLITLDDIIAKGPSATESISVETKDSDPAYIIYTSGSTGKPKGVVVSHQNIIHSTTARYAYYPNQPGSFLLLSSFAFDSSMVGIFWTLCIGGTLVLTEKKIEQDMVKLSGLFDKYQITHTLLLPSLYHLLLEHASLKQLESLNTVMVAGEACTANLCAIHFEKLPKVDLFNEYGPTEASVWCTVHQLRPEDAAGSIPIGKPISNTEIFILDQTLKPVPIGVTGELYVGGLGITEGYLNRPELTEERFLDHPFDTTSKRKIYRTGDLARYRSDGLIDFLGRADQQVKIRGYRIELNEIRDILSRQDLITEAEIVVKINDSNQGQKRLLAFFTAEEKLESLNLQKQLKSALPNYMVPAAFIQLEEMPRLPNGKVDQNALLKIDWEVEQTDSENFIAPQTEIEKHLVDIWEQVLGFSPIGIQDNFFEIGGDSILSIQINGKARKAGLKFPANQIFNSQTIAELALEVQEEENIVQEEEILKGPCHLTPIQHWFFNTHKQQIQQWNQGVKFECPNTLEASFLEKAIHLLIQKHDALRLSFHFEGGRWSAMVNEPTEFTALQYFDFSAFSESEQKQKIEENIQKLSSSFDLTKGQLFQSLYFKRGHQKDVFVLVAHHLIIDNVSWQILTEEISDMIQQAKSGKELMLDVSTISFKRWGQVLKEMVRNGQLKEDFNFWKNLKEVSNFPAFPIDFSKAQLPVSESSISYEFFELEENATEAIVKKVSASFGVKPNEVLLTAFLMAVNKWKSIHEVCIEMEGHGRESIKEGVDFFSSVGWFTSVFPVVINLDTSNTIGFNLKGVKEQIRKIPNKGVTYGMLEYLSDDSEIVEQIKLSAPIVFNYLGIENHLQTQDLGTGRRLMDHMRHAESERHHLLELNISIIQQKLEVSCAYSQKNYRIESIKNLLSLFKKAIKEVIAECSTSEDHSYSPSDFPEADVSQNDLDALFDQL